MDATRGNINSNHHNTFHRLVAAAVEVAVKKITMTGMAMEKGDHTMVVVAEAEEEEEAVRIISKIASIKAAAVVVAAPAIGSRWPRPRRDFQQVSLTQMNQILFARSNLERVAC